MNLSIKPITTYNNVNSFKYNTQWNATASNPATLYFQLVDLDQDGLRVMGASSVQVKFLAVNTTQIITKTATVASLLDSSLWSVSLLASDTPNGGNVQVIVVLNGNTYTFIAPQALSLSPSGFDVGGC